MPPKGKKVAVESPSKIPVRHLEAETTSSPSPPAMKKRRAAHAEGVSGAHVLDHGKATKQQNQFPGLVTQEQPPLPIPESQPDQPAPPSQPSAPSVAQDVSNNTLLQDLNFKVNFMVESLACIESRLDVLFERHDTLSAQIAALTPPPPPGPAPFAPSQSSQAQAPSPPQ